MFLISTNSITQNGHVVKVSNENILSDVDGRGKERPWRKHKLENEKLLEWIIDELENKNPILNISQSYEFDQCGGWLLFNRFKDKSLKLKSARFCKSRVCPICNWRRSLKLFSQVHRMIDELNKVDNFNYLFLTLTLKNCYHDELEGTINKVNYAFKQFCKKVKIKKMLMGYMKAIEITYNKVDCSYHPHLHCILQAPASYYKNYKNADRDRIYVTHSEFRQAWKECLKVDYDPQVNIKKIEDCQGEAIAEVAKYPTKINNLFQLDDEEGKQVLRTFFTATRGKRMISFGGMFKEVRAWLKMKDIEADTDLINADEENKKSDEDAIEEFYLWKFGFYIKS